MPAKSIKEYKSEELATFEDVEVTAETDKAICIQVACPADFEHPYGLRTSWIPKSQIHDNSEVWQLKNGDGSKQKGKLVIPSWLATAKELV
jgi:hypothetical protein